MKKFFLLGLVLLFLATTLLVNVSTVSAKASTPTTPPPSQFALTTVVVYSPYFKGLESGKQIKAQMFAESNLHNLYCVVTDNDGYVLCTASRKYAGQSVVLYLNVGGKNLIFYETLPTEKLVVDESV